MENEGWIEWAGGPCPVPKPPEYELRFRDGVTARFTNVHLYDWMHEGFVGDQVIAYRIAEPLS